MIVPSTDCGRTRYLSDSIVPLVFIDFNVCLMTTLHWKSLFFISAILNGWRVTLQEETCGSGIDKRCPDDMTYVDGDCFIYTGIEYTTNYGDQFCHSRGNHLPRLRSEAQQDYVLNVTGGYPVLLDLMQDDKDTPWEWWDGANDTYRNLRHLDFDIGRSTGQRDCAYKTSFTDVWYDTICATNYKSVCQIPAYNNGSCPGTYTKVYQNASMCYFRNPAYMGFKDHADYCNSLNASILTIHNKEVDNYIQRLLKNTRWYRTFIGLYQRDDTEEFLWGDGTNVDAFNNWAEGQPDDADMNEDCAVLKPDGLWYDEACGGEGRIVCQRSATCQLESLDTTWSHVSKMTAVVDEKVIVTCLDGMFHSTLWTQHFYLTCNQASFMFQPCAKCVAGCKLDLMYAENNIIPLEQRGMLEGETLTVECHCGHKTSNGESTQNITCIEGHLSTVEQCSHTDTQETSLPTANITEDDNDCAGVDCLNGGQCVDLENAYRCDCVDGFSGVHCALNESFCSLDDVDFCGLNIIDPGLRVLHESEELIIYCAEGCELNKLMARQFLHCRNKNNLYRCRGDRDVCTPQVCD